MNNNIYDKLGLVLQALSLEILFKDYNNSDLMEELQKKILLRFFMKKQKHLNKNNN